VEAALKRIRAEHGLSALPEEGEGRGRVEPQASIKNRARGNRWKPRNPGNRSVTTLTGRGNKAAE
jgi:hypothetical protein